MVGFSWQLIQYTFRSSVYIAANLVPTSVLMLTKQVMVKEFEVAVEHMHLLLLVLRRDGVPGQRPHLLGWNLTS